MIITQKDELDYQFAEKESKCGLTLKKAVKDFERQYIDQVIKECSGKINEAADRLGIHRTMVYRKIK